MWAAVRTRWGRVVFLTTYRRACLQRNMKSACRSSYAMSNDVPFLLVLGEDLSFGVVAYDSGVDEPTQVELL
jgi:hypothetical protein